MNENEIVELCSKNIEGNVVGWFQARMEWDTGALGNRSILADQRKKYERYPKFKNKKREF